MITEDYCSYEIAKLLKEKGFDELCYYIYDEDGYILKLASSSYQNICDNNECLCPTHQMAMKWLREEKHYYIQIMLDSWALGGHSGYYIVIQDVNSDFSELSPTEQVFFETHEDAVEEALKYCLENLI